MLMATAAAAMCAASPQAEAVLPASESDVFLCFRATGGMNGNCGYLVNLGPVSQFTGAAGLINVDLGGDVGGDLVEFFGEDWMTRSDLFWSVSAVQKTVGNGFLANTMFASRAEPVPGTQSTPWICGSSFGQPAPAGKMLSMREPGYIAGTTEDQTESTRSTKALFQTIQATNSYRSFMPEAGSNGPSAFGYFTSSAVVGAVGIEHSFANGAELSVLDFYKLSPASGSPDAALVGAFRMSGAGQLTFSPDISFFEGPANVHFEVGAESVNENAANGKITLTVVREGNTNTAFTLNFNTVNGAKATAGVDFTGHTNTPIVFNAGDTSKTVDVFITERAGFQDDRAFTVNLTVATGVATLINPSTETITILESTPEPALLSFSAATYSVAEDAVSGNATLTVKREGELTSAVTVNISTTDDSAEAGVDYTTQTNVQVSFDPNETTETVIVPITNRAGYQGDRSFSVTLSNPSANAEIVETTTATVTIQETAPNPAGTLSFSAPTYHIGFNGAVTALITVTRANGTTGAVDVDVVLGSGGTLTAGQDFTFGTTTLSFVEGQASATLNIPILAAAAPLPGSFVLELANVTNGASIGAQDSATVQLTVPDSILPKLVVTSPKSGKSGASVSLAGSVSDADSVDRVEVRLNGAAPQTATLGTRSGTTTPFSLALNAENGPNTLLVQAFDSNGTASKTTKITFTYVNVRENLAGTYNGLVVPTGVNPPGNNAHNASGFFTVKVSKTGSFTGKVLIGGATLPFGGVLANDQSARFKTTFASEVALNIKGKTPVTLGNLGFAIDSGEVLGVIGSTSTIHAERAAFDGKTPATTVGADYLANKGKYTAAIPSKAQAVLLADAFPQGDGIGNVTITKAGKVSFKGKLADGTPLSLSGSLSSDLEVALYVPLYSKKGSFASLVKLDHSAVDSDFEGEDCLWLRPAQPTAKHYTAGWPAGVKADLVGASYLVPSGASVLPNLGAEDVAAGNATIVAEAGNLTSTKTLNVNISTKNKATSVPLTDKSYKLAISASTGGFSGAFTHTDNTVVKFSGIILQKGINKAGFGYFLSTVPKSGPAGKAGGVSLTAK